MQIKAAGSSTLFCLPQNLPECGSGFFITRTKKFIPIDSVDHANRKMLTNRYGQAHKKIGFNQKEKPRLYSETFVYANRFCLTLFCLPFRRSADASVYLAF